jgi:hypothetical protein
MHHQKDYLDKILHSGYKGDHITLWLVKQTNCPILPKNTGFRIFEPAAHLAKSNFSVANYIAVSIYNLYV